MNIAESFKKFFFALNGTEPTGDTISEVVRNGTKNFTLKKSFVLNSSTAGSTKKFKVTVTDDGTLTASEVVE